MLSCVWVSLSAIMLSCVWVSLSAITAKLAMHGEFEVGNKVIFRLFVVARAIACMNEFQS